jgi:hypothetical protein
MVQEETTEAEAGAGEIELPDIELPQLKEKEIEAESPVLDMAELDNFSMGEEIPAQQAVEPEVKTEEVIPVQSKAASKKQRSKATRKAAKVSHRPRQSLGQWFWRGLMNDNPAAVILLFLLLGTIIAACIAILILMYERFQL